MYMYLLPGVEIVTKRFLVVYFYKLQLGLWFSSSSTVPTLVDHTRVRPLPTHMTELHIDLRDCGDVTQFVDLGNAVCYPKQNTLVVNNPFNIRFY